MTRRAVIVGAGIGGLTAAIALEQAGWSVTVVEQAQALTEVGSGIQISANGTKILDRLGVLPVVEAKAFEAPAIQMRMGRSGRLVFRMPMGRTARDRWGGPHLNVHRADLVDVLSQQVKGEIQLGSAVDRATTDAMVHLADGRSVSADLVIGADGLHSVIRRDLAGPDRPGYTGNIAWRCTVPADAAPDVPSETTIWAGPGCHAITNWLRGGTLLNFVGIVEKSDHGAEDWTRLGDRATALGDYAGWDDRVLTPLRAADQVMCWPLYDRPPTDPWVKGRVALLGDAAHPMVPSMAQGAVQAMEDAWVLAHCVNGDIDAGLRTYASIRTPRATKVQELSMKNLRQFHRRSSLGQLATYGPMALASRFAPSALYARPDWIYRMDPDALIGG